MTQIDPATMIVGHPQVVGCALGDGAALLNLDSNIYYSLNAVGAFIWEELAQPVPFGALCTRVSTHFGAPSERVASDIARLVGRMDEAGLLRCYRE